MQMKQIALAIFNDLATQEKQKQAFLYWLNERHETGALLHFLPIVFAELKKPIYEGVSFDDSPWTAAAELLNFHIEHELEKREGAKNEA